MQAAAHSLVNPWALLAGGPAPVAPPGVASGIAVGMVVAYACVAAPSTPPAVAAPAAHAVPVAKPPPRRFDTRAAATPRPAARRAPEAGKHVRMLDARLTSGFGRRHGEMHWGLDLAAPIGTPIHVPLAGTVISAGPARGFGRWVRVRHADGTVTVYGHVNRALVTVGERVRAGDVIAEVGKRGQATGPHLHIEVVKPGGGKVDPRGWLDEHGVGYRVR